MRASLAGSEWVSAEAKCSAPRSSPASVQRAIGLPRHWRRRPAGTAFPVLHKRTAELFRDLEVAHADGSIGRMLLKLSRIDVLVLDDFAMAPMKDVERRDFLEICDDRYQSRSMVLTSQVPTEHWHEQIGDPTIADSILDRLVHNAHRIELDGESMRKGRGGKPLFSNNCTEGFCSAWSGARETQTPSPCPTPPSPLDTPENNAPID